MGMLVVFVVYEEGGLWDLIVMFLIVIVFGDILNLKGMKCFVVDVDMVELLIVIVSFDNKLVFILIERFVIVDIVLCCEIIVDEIKWVFEVILDDISLFVMVLFD